MAANMKESGRIIKCMVKVNTNGKMVENMKVSINMIRSTGSDRILGLTEENI